MKKACTIDGVGYYEETLYYTRNSIAEKLVVLVQNRDLGRAADFINSISEDRARKIATDEADKYLTQKLLKLVKSI